MLWNMSQQQPHDCDDNDGEEKEEAEPWSSGDSADGNEQEPAKKGGLFQWMQHRPKEDASTDDIQEESNHTISTSTTGVTLYVDAPSASTKGEALAYSPTQHKQSSPPRKNWFARRFQPADHHKLDRDETEFEDEEDSSLEEDEEADHDYEYDSGDDDEEEEVVFGTFAEDDDNDIDEGGVPREALFADVFERQHSFERLQLI